MALRREVVEEAPEEGLFGYKVEKVDGKRMVTYQPLTDWERRTIQANGFKLIDDNTYAREDDEECLARYLAGMVHKGGMS